MKTILIVDDEKVVRQLMEARLGRLYHLHFAENGEEAINKTKEIHPDLVVMDIMMPVMDGAEAADHLQRDPLTAHIPIIFLSALAEGTPGGNMVSSPRHKLLGKPFDADTLIELIEKMTGGGS